MRLLVPSWYHWLYPGQLEINYVGLTKWKRKQIPLVVVVYPAKKYENYQNYQKGLKTLDVVCEAILDDRTP